MSKGARASAGTVFAIATTLAVLTQAFAPPVARAQLDSQEARCQADLAKTARKYFERILKYRIKCENKVITGDLPLATDCLSGMGDDVLERQILKSQARLSVSGSDCNGVNLQLLGFPNECDDETADPFDTSDFKQCVLDRTDAILSQLLDYFYPPLFERQRNQDIALCMQGTPQDATASLIGKIRAREKCLVAQAYGRISETGIDCYEMIRPYGAGTGDERTDDSLETAYVELLGNIPKACAITNIDELGYQDKCVDPTGGNFNIYDLKSCLFTANRVAALEVLATVFPFEGICGNGTIEGDEECDNGIAGNSNTTPNACRTNCQNPDCGDGVHDTNSEECDDGNSVDDDCCRNTCVAAECGDGIVNCQEECDDGPDNSDTEPDACRATGEDACEDAGCGDGVVDTGEECDDDNTSSEDGCSSLCFDEFCGDEIVQDGLGETCDNGSDNGTGPDQCRPEGHPFACQDAQCGDGIIDTGEECDDGDTTSGDGCDSECSEEGFCGDGEKNAGEECDGSDADCPGGVCRTDGSCNCNTVCPTEGELVLYAGIGRECTTNGDCPVGVCDQSIGNCRTVTRLDSGWIGLAHNADINDEVVTRGFLECTNSHAAPCGECTVTGIDPQTDTCRCANDTRVVCDDKFNNNSTQCGACVGGDRVNRFCSSNTDCASTCARRCTGDTLRTCSSNADCLPQISYGTCPEPTALTCKDATACSSNADCESGTCTSTAACQCYFGAPFPLSSGGTPACIVNRFAQDVTGTANVDLGAGSISARLRTVVHLGLGTASPCPVCGGTCSNSATTWCARDEDCPGGTCNDDPVANDGVRAGTCSIFNGLDSGKPCDKGAFNSSFPAVTSGSGGGWYSLDCLPNNNVSNQGLIINLTQTTGPVSLLAQVPCTGAGSVFDCPCLVCSADATVPCNTDADCSGLQSRCSLSTNAQNPFNCSVNADCANKDAGPCNQNTFKCFRATSYSCTTNADCLNKSIGTCPVPTCSSRGTGENPLPNLCENFECTDLGGGIGECTTGPDTTYCEGLVKANGTGILTCGDDEACSPGTVGVDARPCGLVERSGCFLDPITATGVPDPETPIGASVFCIPPTTNVGINSAAGLPGPGRVVNQAKARTFCGNDTSQQYIPGVGGCED